MGPRPNPQEVRRPAAFQFPARGKKNRLACSCLVLALDSIHSEQILVQISMLNTHAYARTGLTLIILETFRGQRLVWIALLITPAHIRVQIDL